jgi:hypothetical protein
MAKTNPKTIRGEIRRMVTGDGRKKISDIEFMLGTKRKKKAI